MRIAFDLDDTLLPSSSLFETEKPAKGILGLFVSERLRRGTSNLLLELEAAGHEVWIYTSSLRPSWSIRLLFRAYGIGLGGVINQQVHDREVGRVGREHLPSKYPPAFGIDVLVDDSEGVSVEGETHGFKVVQVPPTDRNWTDRVRSMVKM
jgi:phosphoserine phosphatase